MSEEIVLTVPKGIDPRESIIKQGLFEAVQASHSANMKAGWWHDLKTGESLKDVKEIHGEKFALMHSEISEALEGHRKNLIDKHLPHRPAVEVELADLLIRAFDYAGAFNLDLAGAVVEKMEYNKNRADHKIENRKKDGGKKF